LPFVADTAHASYQRRSEAGPVSDHVSVGLDFPAQLVAGVVAAVTRVAVDAPFAVAVVELVAVELVVERPAVAEELVEFAVE